MRSVDSEAVILALGGASWPRLGSDAAWVPFLRERGVAVAPLRPANCGFDVGWTPYFKEKFSGAPVKSVAVSARNSDGASQHRLGEFVITDTGVEGGVIYALSSLLRDQIDRNGQAGLTVDLTPDRDAVRLARDLSRPRGKRTLATHLRRYAGISGVKSALLREAVAQQTLTDPAALAAAIKSVPLVLRAARPLEEAISTAGGVGFEELDERLMLRQIPGVFCAGEMLDWEAPTGGYLLTACLATGRAAGAGAVRWLLGRHSGSE
jgi:uncharacterized flavoprotein (TIGR03862 family)